MWPEVANQLDGRIKSYLFGDHGDSWSTLFQFRSAQSFDVDNVFNSSSKPVVFFVQNFYANTDLLAICIVSPLWWFPKAATWSCDMDTRSTNEVITLF